VTDQPEHLDLRSEDILGDKVRELLDMFPEAGTEGGKVDFDRLKLALGEAVDVGKERFGMNWPGKADCFRTIQLPSLGTLLPCPEESVNFDTTQNLIIEGDNLEVLKLLQKSYLGKVKMIYIDPPYNTGNDFIYPDDYSESLQTYLQYTGQVDAEGKKFSTSTEADGRFHSKWMTMMYPRLYLARNLLMANGFIFVTIDDQEVHHLRLIMDEVFGEENFVANVIWQKKYTRANDAKWFSDNHDHVLVFARDKDEARLNLLTRSEEQAAAYSNPDDHPKGPWKATPLHAKSGSNRATYRFQNGVAWAPPGGTFRRYSDETMAQMDAGNEIWFGDGLDSTPSRKSFLSEVKDGVTPVTIWPYQEVGHNHEANSEVKGLMGEGVFDNPKPTRLVRRMLDLATDPQSEDIVLDFFAGAGTTGHAVLALNQEDGGNRRFILVQLPEPSEREGYGTIAEITKERIRRVIATMTARDAGTLDLGGAQQQDRGFRVFKLSSSNFRPWPADIAHDSASLEAQLELHIDHVLGDRTASDLLYEILLKSGFSLTTPVVVESVGEKVVFSVAEGALLICLEDGLTIEFIRAAAQRKPERIVCLDQGFAGNDQLKANAVQIFRTAGIESLRTV
jgi:adenine-specific DNA-methyltransferase